MHPYTFRQDALPPGINAEQVLNILFKQVKVDGLFSDFTDTVVLFLNKQPKVKSPG